MKYALIPLALTCILLLVIIGSSCTGLSTASSGQNPGLQIQTTSLPGGGVGKPYSLTLAASGGTLPYGWSIASGVLPTGVTLGATTGVISGKPSSAGQFAFTAKVTDSSSPQLTATQALSISVSASSVPPLTIDTSSLSGGQTGVSYSATVAASGGTQPYSWSISSGVLPTGLTLGATTGVISGKPSSAGQFAFTVKVTDSSSPQQAATQVLSISVSASSASPLTINTSSVPGGKTGVSYSATVAAAGGTQPYVWSIASGALPAGLTLNTANGVISGTPAFAGQSSFAIKVTDSSAPQQAATKALSISVLASGPAPVQINPGQNIAAIVSSYPAGTTFAINPGTYRLPAPINAKTGDVFVGPCATPPCPLSSQAVLNGSTLLTTFQQSGSYYYVTGQTQQGRVTITNAECQPGYEGCIYPEDLYFDDVPLTHVTSLAAVGPGSWFFDYSGQTIYFYDDPSGHKVETSVSYAAFAPGPANNVTVQGLTVEKFATPALTGAVGGAGTGYGSPSAGANWIVGNNEIRLNHSYGARVNFGWQVLNNYLHDNGDLGMGGGLGGGNADGSGTLSSAVLIQGNEIAYNNYAHFLPGFQSGGSKITSSRGVVVRGNNVHDNDGPGLWTDVGSYSVLYDNNTVANNTTGGIAHEISYAGIVRNNRMLNNGYAVPSGSSWMEGANLASSTSQGLEAYCNTVEVSSQGGNAMTVFAQPRAAGENQVSSGNYFHHNTVFFQGNSGVAGGAWAPSSEQPFFVNNNFDHNDYYLPDLSRKAFAWNNNYNTFAQFQAAGQEVHGTAGTLSTSSFPTVVIDSPADQSTVSGSVDITGTASDATSVSKVEFYVDWALQSTVNSDSFSFAWSTTGVSAGPHTVAAMAYNSEGIRACYGVTLNVP